MNIPMANNPAAKPPAKPNEERPARSADEAMATLANVEGEIREFVRRDVAGPRKALPEAADLSPSSINALLERVAGSPIREIDNLIAELTVVRDYLEVEGERVQRELSNYAQVSQAATASAKVILESMGQWKTAVGPARSEGRPETRPDNRGERR